MAMPILVLSTIKRSTMSSTMVTARTTIWLLPMVRPGIWVICVEGMISGNLLGAAPKEFLPGRFAEQGNADSGDKDRKFGAAAQRAISETLNQNTQHGADGPWSRP